MLLERNKQNKQELFEVGRLLAGLKMASLPMHVAGASGNDSRMGEFWRWAGRK